MTRKSEAFVPFTCLGLQVMVPPEHDKREVQGSYLMSQRHLDQEGLRYWKAGCAQVHRDEGGCQQCSQALPEAALGTCLMAHFSWAVSHFHVQGNMFHNFKIIGQHLSLLKMTMEVKNNFAYTSDGKI